MKPSIEVIETPLYNGVVADEIVATIQECLSERERCSIVLSGGSTPSAVYRTLGRPPRLEAVPWERVDFYWGDERWVPHTDNQSNFKMVQETLLSHLPAPGPRVHPIDTSLPTAADAAAAYTSSIEKSQKLRAGELPTFDLVLLGMGEDGHTASIFPGSPLVTSSPAIAVAAKDATGEHDRVTITAASLFKARRILFIIVGAGKASVLKRVIEGAESESVLPSKLYRTATGRVSFMLDTGAAQALQH